MEFFGYSTGHFFFFDIPFAIGGGGGGSEGVIIHTKVIFANVFAGFRQTIVIAKDIDFF